MPRRDYSQKSHAYRAPRMHVRRDKVKREIIKKRVKALFIAAGLISWTASIGYWVFFSSLFMINDLVVQGRWAKGDAPNNAMAGSQDIKTFVASYLNQRIFFIFPRKNYFLFSSARLTRELEKTQFNPPVETFTIQTEFPHKVLVTFAHRVPRLMVVTREVRQKTQSETVVSGIEHNYLADREGVVVGANPKISSPSLPRVILKTGKVFKQYDAILSAPLVTAVFTLMENFEKQGNGPFLNINILDVEADPEHDDEFIARTENGYSIYFSLQYPLSKQLTYFESVIAKIGDRQSQITYIDLRIDNRAYICCNLELEH